MSCSLPLVLTMLIGLIMLVGCAESASKNQSPIATEEESAVADQLTTEKIATLNAAEEQLLRKQAPRGR